MTPLERKRRLRKALEEKEIFDLVKRVQGEIPGFSLPISDPAQLYYILRFADTERAEFWQMFSPGRFQAAVNRINNKFIAAQRHKAALLRKKEQSENVQTS